MSATCKWFIVACIAALLCYHEAWSSPCQCSALILYIVCYNVSFFALAAAAVTAVATGNDPDQDVPDLIEDVDLQSMTPTVNNIFI